MVPISQAKSFLLRKRANKKNANEKKGRLTKTKTCWIETALYFVIALKTPSTVAELRAIGSALSTTMTQ